MKDMSNAQAVDAENRFLIMSVREVPEKQTLDVPGDKRSFAAARRRSIQIRRLVGYLQRVPRVWNARFAFRSATEVRWSAQVWGYPRVRNKGEMVIGDRVRIVCDVVRSEFVTGPNGRLEIGDGAYINNGASIGAYQFVRIGAQCLIGPHCIMMDNDFHHVEVEKRHEMPESKPIILGDHVWLGARVIVLKGVTIGDYAVVGAGSVVTQDIPPYTVAAGVPARIVRYLPR